MRCHFENGHNELDYACVGDYKPQLYIWAVHTHRSTTKVLSPTSLTTR